MLVASDTLRRGMTSIVHLEDRSGRDVRLQPLDPGRSLGLPRAALPRRTRLGADPAQAGGRTKLHRPPAALRCELETEGGTTRVRRRLEFRFARPLSWFLDPLMGRWLAKNVPAELVRLKAHLEVAS